MALSTLARRSGRFVAVAAALVALGPAAAFGQQAAARPLDLTSLTRGTSPFPMIWKPYRQQRLPPTDFHNGSRLTRDLATGRLQLSYREFLQLVVENNLDLYSARYNTAIAQLDFLRARSGQAARGTADAPLPGSLFAGAIGAGVSTVAQLSQGGTGGAAISSQGRLFTLGPRGNFDPTYSTNVSYDHVVSPLNTKVVAGSSSVTVSSVVWQNRFQQELPWGTSYAISWNLQRQLSTQAGLLFDPSLSSFFAFQVYQPLLNGFGLALNQRFVTVADNDREISVEGFHSTLNNTLSAAANAYWDYMAMRENVRVAEQAAAAAQQQANDNRQRTEIGTMTPLDVLAADAQLASTKVTLVQAQTRLQQQEILIKSLISKTSDPALDAAPIEVVDTLPDPSTAPVPVLQQSIGEALTDRSVVHQAQLALANQHIAQSFTRQNLLPTLSVFAQFTGSALGPGVGIAERQLWQSVYPEYSIGLTLSVPVFNRAAQADDVRAGLEAEQAESSLQRTKSQVTMQVRNAVVSLSRGKAQVEAAARAATASRTAFDGAEEKLRAGVGTPYQVTLAQRDLTSAQSAEIQARVNYAKALVAYQVAVSSFLKDNGVVFDDALHGGLLAGSPTK